VNDSEPPGASHGAEKGGLACTTPADDIHRARVDRWIITRIQSLSHLGVRRSGRGKRSAAPWSVIIVICLVKGVFHVPLAPRNRYSGQGGSGLLQGYSPYLLVGFAATAGADGGEPREESDIVESIEIHADRGAAAP